jgi:hypothetical protein
MSDEAYRAARRGIVNNALRRQQRSLDLSHRGLTRLPPEIGQLTKLESLSLQGNKLSELPPEIGQMKALRQLYLRGNRLIVLPAEFGELSALRTLDLARNQITEFSFTIPNLLRLVRLDLSENQLRALPADIKRLRALQVLGLDQNHLARLPREIGELSTLQQLSVASNSLTVLPKEIGELRSLSYLDISDNRLTSLPLEMADLSNLEFLIADGNPLDEIYRNLLSASHEVSAKSILKYLKDERDLQRVEAASIDNDRPKSTEPSQFRQLAEALEQNPSGAKFEPSDDHFIISASGDSTDRDEASDLTTSQLHPQVKLKAAAVANGAMRLANTHGWQSLPGASERFKRIVDDDLTAVADQIGVVWAELVSLGSFLEQDSEVRENPDPVVEPLPPDVRRSLADLVQTAGPWLRRFPTALKLDNEHASFHASSEKIPPAQKVLKLAEDEDIVRRSDAVVINSALAAGQHAGTQSHKAGGFGIFSVRNVVFGATAFVAAHLAEGYIEHVGGDIAKQSALAKKSISFLHDGEETLMRFLEDLPADIRAAVRTLIQEIRSASTEID